MSADRFQRPNAHLFLALLGVILVLISFALPDAAFVIVGVVGFTMFATAFISEATRREVGP